LSEPFSYTLVDAFLRAIPSVWEPVEVGQASPSAKSKLHYRLRRQQKKLSKARLDGEVEDEDLERIIQRFESNTDFIEFTNAQLQRQMQERLYQARATFAVALAALLLGILLIFVGVILAFTINLSIGVITTTSSVIVEIVSALAFKFNGDTNSRLDSLYRDLYVVKQTSLSIEYIEQLQEIYLRIDGVADLVKRLHASSSSYSPDSSENAETPKKLSQTYRQQPLYGFRQSYPLRYIWPNRPPSSSQPMSMNPSIQDREKN